MINLRKEVEEIETEAVRNYEGMAGICLFIAFCQGFILGGILAMEVWR